MKSTDIGAQRRPESFNDWEAVLTKFLSTLNSPATRKNYRRAIKSAMKVIESRREWGRDSLRSERTQTAVSAYSARQLLKIGARRRGTNDGSRKPINASLTPR